MKLPEYKSYFLKQFRDKFLNREFIIDVFTQVANRPCLEVYASEMPTEKEPEKTIVFKELPADAKYIKPWGVDKLPASLKNDPVHVWRAESGIELIHKEPDIFEQIRIYRNFQLMTPEQKHDSDEKCKEFFGCTNEEYFTIIMKKYKEQEARKTGVLGDIFSITYGDYSEACVCYISNIDFEKGSLSYRYLDNGLNRIISETDTFTVQKGDLKCITDTMETTAGRFLLNYLLVEYPFVGTIPYINKPGFDLKGLESTISQKLISKEIEIVQYKQYVNNLFFIGHFTELCVPSFTRASLTTDPNIKKIKEELLKKYEGRLDDPEVIMEIENTLISADKEYLKNDTSMRFYAPLGGKPFNIARKKMYLTVGGIEAFSKDSGKYTFIKNSLSEGWDVSQIAAYANEIRKGSYNRGHETQLGGAQTKYIVRVFQDLSLTEEDCHTHTGLIIDFGKYDIKDYIGRYIKDKSEWVEITTGNMSKYSGGKYVMRSPMFCKTKNGLCNVCAGKMFSKLDVKHISMYIVDISSTFMMVAMKLMHGSKLEMIDLGDLNQYLI